MEFKFVAHLLVILVLVISAESQWIHPRPPLPSAPLCASQFALANHACSLLPYTPVPPPGPPSPVTPEPPTPEPPAPEDGTNNNHRHHHHHVHHRHRHHVHGETQAEGDCCRWIREIDDVCVCDLLVRLPPFLARPVHNYTVVVDETCSITFQCGSRLVRA